MKLKSKSYRGKLIEVLIIDYIEKHLYDLVDATREALQRRFDIELCFYTVLTHIEAADGHVFGEVFYVDIDRKKKQLAFKISTKTSNIVEV